MSAPAGYNETREIVRAVLCIVCGIIPFSAVFVIADCLR